MDRIDPRNTTALEGRPCQLCGDDATGVERIDNRDVATCDDCHEYALVTCDSCGRRGLFEDFYRFGGHETVVKCSSCARPILSQLTVDRDTAQQTPKWKKSMDRVAHAQALLWNRTPLWIRNGLLAEVDAQKETTHEPK